MSLTSVLMIFGFPLFLMWSAGWPLVGWWFVSLYVAVMLYGWAVWKWHRP